MMKCLLHPLILLLVISSLASCRLVNDFLAAPPNGCSEFFARTNSQNFQRATPTILQPAQRYRQICQQFKNKDRFATLYDTQNRIPVYSAFRHFPTRQINRAVWRTEPNLAGLQANNQDYGGNDKISLFPAYNDVEADDVTATFTLTNAAPRGNFNQQTLESFDQQIVQAIDKHCGANQAYIVTGVVPSERRINERVTVPNHFWSAYCCQQNGKRLSSGGYITSDSGEQLPIALSVRDLGSQLARLHNVDNFQVFGDNC